MEEENIYQHAYERRKVLGQTNSWWIRNYYSSGKIKKNKF